MLVAASIVASGCSSREQVDLDAAVLEVAVSSCVANQEDRATAAVIDRGLALTAAHTFEEAADVSVMVDGGVLDAELVHLDVERDIALLAFDAAAPVEVLDIRDDSSDASDSGRVVVFRDDAATVEEVSLLRRTEVTLDGEGRRQGIELGGSIDSGDSGAPVVDGDGRLIGMVFAASRTDETGWAVAGSELVGITDQAGPPLPLTC